jgi:hypothetical protein
MTKEEKKMAIIEYILGIIFGLAGGLLIIKIFL